MFNIKRSALMTALASLLVLPTVYAESNLDFYQQNKNKVDINNKSAVEEMKKKNDLYGDIKDKNNEQTFKLGLSGGSLTLSVPQPLRYEFGEPILSEGNGNRIPITVNGQLLVSDLRATGEGWHLTIEAEPLTEVKKEQGIMPKGGWYKAPPGTIILTSTPVVTSKNASITEGIPAVNFYGREKEIAIDNGPVTVVSADYGEGMGEWVITLSSDSIQVILNEKTLKQDLVNYPDTPTPYTTKIKWTLVSGPGSEQPIDVNYYINSEDMYNNNIKNYIVESNDGSY